MHPRKLRNFATFLLLLPLALPAQAQRDPLKPSTAKAVNPPASEVLSTPALGEKFNPGTPPDTSNVPK